MILYSFGHKENRLPVPTPVPTSSPRPNQYPNQVNANESLSLILEDIVSKKGKCSSSS